MAGSSSNGEASPAQPPARRNHRPSPGRPTREQAIARDRELLDKALDLFLENGFEGTSIEAITAAVGMAKRTIYVRFGDKRSLFEAALKRAIDEWIVPVERLRKAETDSLEASLLAIGQMLVANILSPAGLRLLQITNAESRRMPEIAMFTNREGTGATLEFLAELFLRRVPGIGAERAGMAALAFLNLVVGGPANQAVWGTRLDADVIQQMTAFNVTLFLSGLLPR